MWGRGPAQRKNIKKTSYLTLFILRSFDLSLSLVLLPTIQASGSDCFGQNKASSQSLVFTVEIHVIGTERGAQVKPTSSSIFEQLGAMGRTSGQPQAKVSVLRRISLKLLALYKAVKL
jgi:hypothetical protein